MCVRARSITDIVRVSGGASVTAVLHLVNADCEVWVASGAMQATGGGTLNTNALTSHAVTVYTQPFSVVVASTTYSSHNGVTDLNLVFTFTFNATVTQASFVTGDISASGCT